MSKAKEVVKFSRKQILESARFKDKKDLVNAVCTANGMYSVEEVETAIEKYLKGKVNK
jgi:hypothetical protein